QAFLDAFGDGNLAFAGQQLHRAHLAHVHAYRIGGATDLGVHGGKQRHGFLGGGVVVVAAGGIGVDGVRVGRRFQHLDAHAVDHRDDVFDLLGVDHVVGQVVVDLAVGQVALLTTLGD